MKIPSFDSTNPRRREAPGLIPGLGGTPQTTFIF